jgi:hypothetical protein
MCPRWSGASRVRDALPSAADGIAPGVLHLLASVTDALDAEPVDVEPAARAAVTDDRVGRARHARCHHGTAPRRQRLCPGDGSSSAKGALFGANLHPPFAAVALTLHLLANMDFPWSP